MAQPKVALQLYTLREAAKDDFVGTLRQTAAAGYGAVELAGYGGLTASALKAVLAELNLTVAAAHISLARLEGALDEEIDYHLALGNRDLVCPMLPAERRADLAGWRQAAASLGAIGRRCRQRGLRFSYHNHAFEFEPVGGRTGLELLLEETDPADVAWEPDVYWIDNGGQEPATWLRRYAGRCPLVHLKDKTAGATPTFAEVGAGVLDFKPILAASADAEWYIVEQDRCAGSPLASIAISRANLQRWGY